MSTGGVFTIINNDGNQDKLLLSHDRLVGNLKRISLERLAVLRKQNPNLTDKQLMANREWLPTLTSIEKSHVLFINTSFKPFVSIAHEYSKLIPCGGVAGLGSTFHFTIPINGEFVNDSVMYIRLSGLAAKNASDKVRYVEYLAHKLVNKVSFKVQNHEIDYYTSDAYNIHYQYEVAPGKENGYLSCIGQEVPKLGYLTANPVVDEVREYRYFGDGPQTFKQKHSVIEMWVPILFWFRDIKNALPNFLIPKDQTNIEVTFDKEANLVAFADYGGGGSYIPPKVEECSLYMNHIYIDNAVWEIYKNCFKFQLIRVHRYHKEILENSTGSIRLHQLKWPVESLFLGIKPLVNLNNSQKWHRNTHITERVVKQPVITGGVNIQINDAVYFNEQHVVDKLELKIHDVTIYPSQRPQFYNHYLPYQYGEFLKTPKDLGWYMINFNFNPDKHQPSGYINLSNSREVYLNYISSNNPDIPGQAIIRKENPAELTVIAQCINFLQFTGGSVVLTYPT